MGPNEDRGSPPARQRATPWTLVWQVDPDDFSSCIERDWLADLLAEAGPVAAIVDHGPRPRLSARPGNAIVCVSSPNQTSAADLAAYVRSLPRPRVLYHMSDEFLAVGRQVYDHCDLAIRNGSANFDMAGDPRFLQVPLGYASGLGNGDGAILPASRRKASHAFLGALKHERASEMLPALATLPGMRFVRQTPSFAAGTRYFGNLTVAAYRNAVFVPNPKGNWNPECNRLYDALEWGCIPLIRRYRDSDYHVDYHDRLLGPNPLPTFDAWDEAADFARGLLADPDALDARQAAIAAWWREHKAWLRAEVAKRLAALAA